MLCVLTKPQIITRHDVKEVLLSWQTGESSTEEVHEWGERRYATDAYEVDDWEGEDQAISLCNLVLAELDQLDMNLRTAADVPILLACLEGKSGDAGTVAANMEEALNRIDLTERAKELMHHPVYAPFCRDA